MSQIYLFPFDHFYVTICSRTRIRALWKPFKAGGLSVLLQVAANPRNDLRQELSYGVVERLEIGEWVTVATDADWDTK